MPSSLEQRAYSAQVAAESAAIIIAGSGRLCGAVSGVDSEAAGIGDPRYQRRRARLGRDRRGLEVPLAQRRCCTSSLVAVSHSTGAGAGGGSYVVCAEPVGVLTSTRQ